MSVLKESQRPFKTLDIFFVFIDERNKTELLKLRSQLERGLNNMILSEMKFYDDMELLIGVS